ncbi:hypothetical protein RAS12_12030 [Achromobacter seleniivolatilans]|uniref:Uncharacterized protein n=1 Tax=Achromobacter seleniivolatilans TaxID=3047478 RepID=A0ABY9M7U8_9BURK|nr:hypothetical protein [Achromobacter sp. R39]WMD23066.1 hypothetical protein RAS12_12030 [Achromobacter sp. R39]
MHKPRNPFEQLEAAKRARNQYIRLYDAATAELSELKGRAADLRERCATLASALEITTSILEASTDNQLKASAAAARSLLNTAGRAPVTEAHQ